MENFIRLRIIELKNAITKSESLKDAYLTIMYNHDSKLTKEYLRSKDKALALSRFQLIAKHILITIKNK